MAQQNAPTHNPVHYHGGPVMQHTSATYAIFWEPRKLQDGKRTHVSKYYNPLIMGYFNDVSGSNLYDNNTQYYDGTGHIVNSSAFEAAWVDRSPYPASSCNDPATPSGCLIDTQIQAEITKAMASSTLVQEIALCMRSTPVMALSPGVTRRVEEFFRLQRSPIACSTLAQKITMYTRSTPPMGHYPGAA